jgi:spore coat polysaccharide biosynthesis protein SpsF (cytidylyltransferase family)
MTVAIIIQARMGSHRFPGKIMAPFLPFHKGGERQPVLAHVLRRCFQVHAADRMILATPSTAEHRRAWELARGYGALVCRGSESNVLSRFYKAARELDLQPRDTIVRITADCPLTDPAVVGELIELHQSKIADYTCNVMPRTYPKGLDCEAMTFEALEAAWVSDKSAYGKEHVTPWLQRTEGINRHNLHQGEDMSHIDLCIDYPGDPGRIEKLIETHPFGQWRENERQT